MTSRFPLALTLVLGAAALAGGCASPASTEGSAASPPVTQREYRTGSNIPSREPKSASEAERARAAAEAEAQRKGSAEGKATN